MPKFSLESAGVMPSGGVDDSVKLSMKERAEKVIKVGVVCLLLLCFKHYHSLPVGRTYVCLMGELILQLRFRSLYVPLL